MEGGIIIGIIPMEMNKGMREYMNRATRTKFFYSNRDTYNVSKLWIRDDKKRVGSISYKIKGDIEIYVKGLVIEPEYMNKDIEEDILSAFLHYCIKIQKYFVSLTLSPTSIDVYKRILGRYKRIYIQERGKTVVLLRS
jgi:hypothetical protein